MYIKLTAPQAIQWLQSGEQRKFDLVANALRLSTPTYKKETLVPGAVGPVSFAVNMPSVNELLFIVQISKSLKDLVHKTNYTERISLTSDDAGLIFRYLVRLYSLAVPTKLKKGLFNFKLIYNSPTNSNLSNLVATTVGDPNTVISKQKQTESWWWTFANLSYRNDDGSKIHIYSFGSFCDAMWHQIKEAVPFLTGYMLIEGGKKLFQKLLKPKDPGDQGGGGSGVSAGEGAAQRAKPKVTAFEFKRAMQWVDGNRITKEQVAVFTLMGIGLLTLITTGPTVVLVFAL